MKKSFKVYLKAGERLFVNGAVLRVDRKVSVEFLNDVTFLLEGNVLQSEEATTPLRQLYFVVQAILIDSERSAEARDMYSVLHQNFMKSFVDEEIHDGLSLAQHLVADGRLYDALKVIRALFLIEDQLAARRSRQIGLEGVSAQCR